MSTQAWKNKNAIRVHLRITKNSGVPEALEQMEDETGKPKTKYIMGLLEEALIRDGYLTCESKTLQNH